jgi:STE24 endopeptidase
VSVQAADVFSAEQVERARRYHRPLYLALAVDLIVGIGGLAILAFSRVGDAAFRLVDGGPWWVDTLAFVAVVLVLTTLVRVPVSFWRSYLHEKEWELSTQTLFGWLGDTAKGFLVTLVFSWIWIGGLIALARGFPSWWALVAALGSAVFVLVVGFVAPLVLEPLFNRFEPLADTELADELRSLAEKIGTPVRDVLVADASRRTKKSNAYVSGFGATRRVVLYDTLLERSDPRVVKLVIAHELGHRRDRHVAKGTALGMLGAAGAVLAMWALLRSVDVRAAVGVSGAGDPRVVPFLMLVGVLLELLALPLGTALSRRWERAADRFSLEVTRDPEAFETAHRELATSNLSDLQPPRALYVLTFSHPTPVERIAAARRWGTSERPAATA